ncbi:unnamed protein product [Linum tenue]|uniref:Uncharacterized protein n=1 Tax=Linum tenue TaxID=586396 RepID=A0AAV0NNQ4_9ROSI|nr:unnamed protein product [Linum tenue]
MGPIRRRD